MISRSPASRIGPPSVIYHLTIGCFERMCQRRSSIAEIPDLVDPTPTVSGDVPMSEEREKVPRSPDETTYEALRLEEMKIRVDGARVEHARQIAQTEHEDRVRRMELEGIRARQAHEESERAKDAAANEILRRATLESGLARLASLAAEDEVNAQAAIAERMAPHPSPIVIMSDEDEWERDGGVAVDRVMHAREDTVERERDHQRNIRARKSRLRVLKGMAHIATTCDVRTAIRLDRRDVLFRVQMWLSQVKGVHALHIRLRGFAAIVAQIFREETEMCDPIKFPSPYGARLDILANHYTVDDLFILERAYHVYVNVQGRSFNV